jgi:hypothetical protein
MIFLSELGCRNVSHTIYSNAEINKKCKGEQGKHKEKKRGNKTALTPFV